MAMINTRHLKPQVEYREAKLTPQQQTNFDALNTIIFRDHPFFSFVLIEQLDLIYTEDVGTAGTDGWRIWICPSYFMKLSMPEQVFGFTHEVMHCIWEHMQRGQAFKLLKPGGVEYYPVLANIAQDARINADLIASNIGRFNPNWIHDQNVTPDEIWEEIYMRYYKRMPKVNVTVYVSGGAGEGQGSGQGDDQMPNFGRDRPWRGYQWDKHLPPPIDERTGKPVEAGDVGMKETVINAAAFAKSQGKFPLGLQRYIDALLEPQIAWEEHFAAILQRCLGQDGVSYAKPHRRRSAMGFGGFQTIWPGKVGTAAGGIIGVVDTSGSMGRKELTVGVSEFVAILRDRRPAWFRVIWCDAKVHRIDEGIREPEDLEAAVANGIPGGGGTDFRPVFDAIDESGEYPAALVFFTDGYGTFPNERPPYEVVWVMTTDVAPPWGEVVRVEVPA